MLHGLRSSLTRFLTDIKDSMLELLAHNFDFHGVELIDEVLA